MEVYIEGVSVRRVDDLLKALGLTRIDKSAVSRICQHLDGVVEPFRQRPLQGAYPYLWLDALYVKVRQNHRIINQAVVIGIGVRETGEREIVGFAVGASEEAFWLEFLRSLLARGLHGVQLVISDAHEGLKAAIGKVFNRATWQRCRVHCLRNLLAHVPQGDKAMVAAAVRTIFAQPNRQTAGQQLQESVAFSLTPTMFGRGRKKVKSFKTSSAMRGRWKLMIAPFSLIRNIQMSGLPRVRYSLERQT